MAELARSLVEAAGPRQGQPLDFSDASILAAEQAAIALLDEMSATLAGDALENGKWFRCYQLGAYVGETFIRNHGGSWGWANTPDVGKDLGLLTGDGCIAFPITKARKRLTGSEMDSVVTLYKIMVNYRTIMAQRDAAED